MAKGFTIERFDHVLKCDAGAPEVERSKFHLRTLEYLEREEVERLEWKEDKADGATMITLDQLGVARSILGFALLGWSNFPAGAPVPFERQDPRTVSPASLTLIQNYAVELANAVTRRSRLSEQAEKNS